MGKSAGSPGGYTPPGQRMSPDQEQQYLSQVPEFARASLKAQMEGSPYQQAAEAQSASNHVNQSGPFGGTSWAQGPDGRWTQSQSFGGPLGDLSKSLQSQALASMGSPMDNGSAARDQAISSMYGQARSRLDPQWDQREQQVRAQLAGQGLDPDSEAGRQAMGQFGRDRNDAYTSAMNGAIGMGNQAQALTFNENMAARQMPLEEMMQMRGLINPGQLSLGGGTPYLQATGMFNDYNLQNAQQQNGFWGDIFGGAGRIGAAAATGG